MSEFRLLPSANQLAKIDETLSNNPVYRVKGSKLHVSGLGWIRRESIQLSPPYVLTFDKRGDNWFAIVEYSEPKTRAAISQGSFRQSRRTHAARKAIAPIATKVEVSKELTKTQ